MALQRIHEAPIFGVGGSSPSRSASPSSTLTEGRLPPAAALTAFDFSKLRITAPSTPAEAVRDVLRAPGEAIAPPMRARMESGFAREVAPAQAPAALAAHEGLAVSAPGDASEREADRAAERVTGAARTATSAHRRVPNFSDVRIHTDSRAAEAARGVGALAFTAGRHIVFGHRQYRPETPSGEELLAHELSHVAQQRGLATSSRPDAPLMLQRRTSDYPTEPDSGKYSVFRPKRLNAKGPFTGSVLDLISMFYTDPSWTGNRQTGALIINLLESSPEFLRIAKVLDAHYAKDSNPAIRVSFGFNGAQFAPAGTPFMTQGHRSLMTTSPSVDVMNTDPERDVIFIDPGAYPKISFADPAAKATADEQRAVAFVRALIHESIHAYRHVTGATGTGLSGALTEERTTRLYERAVVKEIGDHSKSAGVKSEADASIAQYVGTGKLSDVEVALSLVSGDRVTYLEKYYLDKATRLLDEKYETSRSDLPELERLDDPTTVSLDSADPMAKNVEDLLGDLSKVKPAPKEEAPPPEDTTQPETTPPSKGRAQPRKKAAKTAKPKPKKKEPPPWVLGGGTKADLTTLLESFQSLDKLTSAAKSAKKLAHKEERALYFYVLLLKTREISVALGDAHEKSTLDTKSKEYRAFCDELAEKYFGVEKAYDSL